MGPTTSPPRTSSGSGWPTLIHGESSAEQVEPSQDASDVLLAPPPRRDCGVHGQVGGPEVEARAAAVAVAADRQVRELAGHQPVSHRVEHRELERVAVDGVVE